MREISIEVKLPPEQTDAPPVDEELEMYYHARSFFIAGARSGNQVWLSPNSYNLTVAPAVTCYAMSIELYIKLLCKISTGSYDHHHRISEHFKQLPEFDKDNLAVHYEQSIGRSRLQLEEDIKLISEAFVDWRYLYDKRHFLFLRETRPDGPAGYYDHLYWKIVSGVFRDTKGNAKNVCERCMKRCNHSQVHHKTYDHVGEEFENLKDLELLCEVCHARQHNEPMPASLCIVCRDKIQLGLRL